MLGLLKKKERRDFAKKIKPREKKNFQSLRDASRIKPKHWYHFITKLFSIIIKNYKLLIRSKTSALIFFFGPLFIVFLVGIGFNSSTLHDINIATYSASYSPLSESLISNLSDSQFNVVKMDSQQNCINSVKYESYHVCLVFSDNMVLDNSGDDKIELYVDNSRINLANLITEKLAAKVDIKSEQLSSGLVSQILGAMDEINQKSVQGKSYLSSLEENQKQSKIRASSTLSDFSMLDFQYTSLDVSKAQDELESVRDRFNISSGYITGLKDEINKLKTEYNRIATKLDEAKSHTDSLQDGVASIATTIESNTANIDSLKSMNNDIITNINTIKITNVDSIVSPLRTVIKPLTLKRSYLVYTFPSLLVLLIMFVSLLMSATGIMREKKSMAYFRNFITPTFSGQFMIGQFLSDIGLIFFQLLIILGVASIFIKGISWQAYLIAGCVLLLLASIFIFMGLALGYLFNTDESVTVGAVSIGLVFLLFSNAIMPLESLSGFLRDIVLYNPFVLGETILKRLVIFDSSMASIAQPVYALLVWLGVVILATIIIKISTRKMAR